MGYHQKNILCQEIVKRTSILIVVTVQKDDLEN